MLKRRLVAGILSAAVSIMQLVPAFTITSFADDEDNAADAPTVSVEEGVYGSPDGRVDVELELSNNPGLSALMVIVNYDPDTLEFYDVYDDINWGNDNFDYGYDENGTIILNWTSDDIITDDDTLATLTFDIKEDAEIGASTITLSTVEGSNFRFDDPDHITDYKVNFKNGSIGVLYDIKDVIQRVDIGTDGSEGTELTPVIYYKKGYSEADVGEISYSWYSWSVRSDDYTDKTYTVVADDKDKPIYVTVSAEFCNGEIDSNEITGLMGKLEKPDHDPEIEIETNWIVIGEMPGCEYAIIENDDTPPDYYTRWDSLESDRNERVSAGSTYYIYIRYEETDTENASEWRLIIVKMPNDDAALASITVKDGNGEILIEEYDPSANSTVTAYVPEDYSGAMPVVSAVPNDPNATVEITQAKDFNDNNKATIHVKAENSGYPYADYDDEYYDEDDEDYYVEFVKQERSDVPEFDPDDDERLPRDGRITITADGTIYYSIGDEMPSLSSEGYYRSTYIDLEDLDIPLSQKELVVHAVAVEDGKAVSPMVTKKYTLAYTDARLSSLKVNGIEINGFSPDKTEYTYTVSYPAWYADPEKTYQITADTLTETSEEPYIYPNEITLEGDPQKATSIDVTIEVTAENGDVVVYTVTFVVDRCRHESVEPDEEGYIAPTCDAEGSQIYRCKDCGNYAKTVKLQTIDHVLSDWETETEATCEEDGKEVRKCTMCGEVFETRTISATGHRWGEWTQVGDTNVYVSECENNCGQSKEHTAADTSHTHIFHGAEIVNPAPTCEKEGTLEIHCTVEGCLEFVTESIPKLTDHVAGEPIVRPATCTETGHSEVRCIYCGKVLSETTIPKIPHTYGEDEWESNEYGHWHECSVCQNEVNFNSHTSDGGVITVQPTENTTGEKVYTCIVCGFEIDRETLPALGEPSQGDPTDPDDPSGPSTPGTPSDPGTPSTPDTPSDPSNPSTPDTPSNPSTPGTPSNPSTPGTPSNPSTPSTPIYPDFTDVPSSSAMPAFGGNTNAPYITEDSALSGWDLIEYNIDSANDGEVVNVTMNGFSEVPESIFSSIQGRDIDLTLDMGRGFIWRINGRDVESVKDINMGVSNAINKIPRDLKDSLNSERDVVELKLDHKGNFGFTAELHFTVPNRYNSYYATLYYYNTKTGELEYSGSYCQVSNNNVSLKFSHASYYAVGFSKEPLYDDVAAAAAATANVSPIDMGIPSANGTGLLQLALPGGGLRLSNKKRRYRVLRKRRLDDLVFVL